MPQTNEDIALRKYLKDTVGDTLAQIQQEQESINKSITSLAEGIGSITFPGFPDDYARKDDLDSLRNKLAFDKTKMTCKLSSEDSDKISELKRAYLDARDSCELLAEERRKKRINIKINLPAQYLGAILLILGLGFGVLCYWMNNLPEYLAHQYYELKSQMDCPCPGLYYDDALAKARAGNIQDVKDDIKQARNDLKKQKEYESILLPLLDNRPLHVMQIEYELDSQCALVTYRFKDNDIKWKAFFLEDGSIKVTDSEFVNAPYDARKMLTSRKVKWEEVK